MGNELLLEVGVEEVPSHYLPQTLGQMGEIAPRLFRDNRLAYQEVRALATPRRLVLYVQGLADRQAASVREVQGPPKAVGLDAGGQPTQAALAFARAQGVAPGALKVQKTARGEYLFARVTEKRQGTAGLLKGLLPQFLESLFFPKSMQWNESRVRFVRPVRWVLALYGGSLIPFRFAGVRSGAFSYGHPLMRPGKFAVRRAGSYFKELGRRFVAVDPAERKAMILKQVEALARAQKGRLHLDESLLEQNVFQTEYPTALCGRFNQEFLALPPEVLMNVMKEQQGYFALYDPKGRLLPHFICVTDLKVKGMALIRKGHERVLKARLEDARFYFEEDQKTPLEGRVEGLKGVIFHEQLGTVYEKMERLVQVASFLAERLEPAALPSVRRAARLCKADLLSGMVREFPALQGLMGREYARRQGEGEEVSRAIFEHYLPRWAGDALMPKVPASKFLAIADKLDTVSGCFAIGLQPTGSEDPYALRRLGQGLVRILVDQVFIGLSLRELAGVSLAALDGKVKGDPLQIQDNIVSFLRERMQSFLRGRADAAQEGAEAAWFEGKGHRSDLVDAVLLHRFDNVAEAYRRIVALVIFHKTPEFDPLMVAYKRAARIVPTDFSVPVREALLKESVERDLFAAGRAAREKIGGLIRAHQYQETLEVLASLRRPIDAFFDKVFVMDQDLDVRNNRLALLKEICELFYQFADFSQVVVDRA